MREKARGNEVLFHTLYTLSFHEFQFVFCNEIKEDVFSITFETLCFGRKIDDKTVDELLAGCCIAIGFPLYLTSELPEKSFFLELESVAGEWEYGQGYIRISEKSENGRIILIGNRRKGCPIELSWDRPSESEAASLVPIKIESTDNLRIFFDFLTHGRYPVVFSTKVILILRNNLIKIP